MDLVISPVAIALAGANCLWIMWRAWRKRQNDRQLAAINAQMQQIKSAVVPEKVDLDGQIEVAFEQLLSNPSEELYRRVIELISKRQEELFNTLQFSSVEEFIQKRKAISDLMAEALSKLDDILIEKGIATQTQTQTQGAGVGLDTAAAAPAQKGKLSIVEQVEQKKGLWCGC